jgi:hypothetical protein
MSDPSYRYGADNRTASDEEGLRLFSLQRGPDDVAATRNYEEALCRGLAEDDHALSAFHDIGGLSLRNQYDDTLRRHGESHFLLRMLSHSEQHIQRRASLLTSGLTQSLVIAREADRLTTPLPATWVECLDSLMTQGQQTMSMALSSAPGVPHLDAIRADYFRSVDAGSAARTRLTQSLFKQVDNNRINARRLQIADKYSYDVSSCWFDLVLEARSRDASADFLSVELLTTAISSAATLSSGRGAPKTRAPAAPKGGASAARAKRQKLQHQQQLRQQQQQQQLPPQSRRQDRSRSPPRRRSRSRSGDRRRGAASSRGGDRGRETRSRGRR